MKEKNDMTRLIAAALLGISLIASSTGYAGEKTVTLTVPGMYCAACPITVKSSLEADTGRRQGGRLAGRQNGGGDVR